MAFFEMQAKSESRMSTDEWIARIPPQSPFQETLMGRKQVIFNVVKFLWRSSILSKNLRPVEDVAFRNSWLNLILLIPFYFLS